MKTFLSKLPEFKLKIKGSKSFRIPNLSVDYFKGKETDTHATKQSGITPELE